jgi:hypothetical protein
VGKGRRVERRKGEEIGIEKGKQGGLKKAILLE